MNVQSQGRALIKDDRLIIARMAWVAFALILTVTHAASQIASFREAQNISLTPNQLQGLQAMGLSMEFLAVSRFLWQLPLPLFWGALGLLIFLRRSRNPAALILSAMMLGLSMAGSIPLWKAFANEYPTWIWLVAPMAFISNLCINSFFLVFPTGRYVPRWGVGIVLFLSVYNLLNSYAFALPPALLTLGKYLDSLFPIFVVTALGSFIGAPIYRYRRVSTSIEREQIKWVVIATAFAFIFFALATSTAFLVPNGNPDTDISIYTVFFQPMGWTLSLQLIPIAITLSILRYRLFDIDFIIRRTLQYSVLTALLATIYFGSVVLLQRLSDTFIGQQSPAVIVISTLLIAALFTPLRRRVQNVIDRRFFRRK